MRKEIRRAARLVGLWVLCARFMTVSDAVEVKFRAPGEDKTVVASVKQKTNDETRENDGGRLESTGEVERLVSTASTAAAERDSETIGSDNSTERDDERERSRFPDKASVLSAAERDEIYPKSREATLMTIEELIPSKRFGNVRVLRAFTRVPRADFVARKQRASAYLDQALPAGDARFSSRPFDVACELEALDPQESERVLVVETGGGYCAALLSCLGAEVYVVGADRELVKRAADAFKKRKDGAAAFLTGDPRDGWKEKAPFDKIVVTRAVDSIPSALVDQLKEGGKIVAPVGDRYRQAFVLGEKKDGKLFEFTLTPTKIELLERRAPEKTLPSPSLVGGDFEDLDPEPGTPRSSSLASQGAMTRGDEENAKPKKRLATPSGWRDACNFEVVDLDDAYSGRRACLFSNEAVAAEHAAKDRNAERVRAATLPEFRVEKTTETETIQKRQRERELWCQMRQSFPVDGTKVKKLVVSGAYRVRNLASRRGRSSAEIARLEFFDKDGKTLGTATVADVPMVLGDWRKFSSETSAPPRAKEATLTIGLLDSIGTIEMDGVLVKDKFEKKDR